MNFAGDNREESDFLTSKRSIWRGTATLASEIIAAYEALPDDKEIILTGAWWERQRYNRFGQEMAQKFNKSPKLKQELR